MRSRSGYWLDIALAVVGMVLGTIWWMIKATVRVLLLVSVAVIGFVIGLKLSRR